MKTFILLLLILALETGSSQANPTPQAAGLSTPISITFTTSNVLCFGGSSGSAMASATGGTPPYTYHWNTGGLGPTINNLTIGVYQVVVTDSLSVSASASCFIDQPSSYYYTAWTTVLSCYGDSSSCINVGAIGGGTPPFSFVWSDTPLDTIVSPTNVLRCHLPMGSYDLTILDSNRCKISGQFSVIGPSLPISFTSTFTNPTSIGGNDGSIQISAMGGFSYYHYSIDGGLTYDTLNTFTGLSAGCYYLTVRNGPSCVTGPDTICLIDEPLGLSFLTNTTLNISPNPASFTVAISIDETMLGSNLTITDITGREVLHSAFQIRNPQFDIRNLSQGIYFITIETRTGKATKKLVKQ